MRIVSLLPSATEIVYALGLGDELVAVTHECDAPQEARTKPSVTRNLLPMGLTSARINDEVSRSQRDAHTIYALDAKRLVELAPDVVLTQSLCEVCAVPRAAVDEAVCSMPSARVVSLDPHTLVEMLASIVRAAEALSVRQRGEQLAEDLRQRIDAVREIAEQITERPRVFCCEWLDPIFCAGHWVPEQVRLAGGDEGFGREGEPSRVVAWDDVVRYAPEVVILMPCGFDAAQTAARADELARRPGWAELPAVRHGQVFAVNGSAYFSRPGPRLVDGLELLARILHRPLFPAVPEGAALQLVDGEKGCFDVYR